MVILSGNMQYCKCKLNKSMCNTMQGKLKQKFSLENSPKCPYPTIPTFKDLSAISTK